MKKTKFLAAVLAAILCAASLVSCDNENNTEDKTTDNSLNQSSSFVPALSNYDWKYDDDEIMFTVDGLPVTFEDYRFYAMSNKQYFDYGDDSYWTDITNNEYQDIILDSMKQLYAIKSLCNNKLGITFDSEDAALLDAKLSSLKEYYGEETFNTVLDQAFFTEEHYKEFSEFDYLTEKLYRSFVTDEEIIEYANENFTDYIRAQHVLIKTVDEFDVALPDEQQAEKKALADEIYQKAISGEDFSALVKQYGEDPGMQSNPNGYVFTYGTMVEEFEEASFALEVGGISEPVKTDFGYHIIKKLPLNEEYFLDRSNPEYVDIIYTLGQEEAQKAITEHLETLEVVETDAFKELTMQNIGTPKK